jgi:pyroglutamyl-peptidase
MKVLVTGFEPFGGESVNPALEAVLRLPSGLGALEIATRPLPSVFGRALAALEDALVTTRPDIVLCVGQAGGRAELSLERVAINVDDARIPDNDGQQPLGRPVVAGGPAAYFATLPIKAAVRALREAGLPAAVSNTAGTFVCNHVFYGLMHLAATRQLPLRGDFSTFPFCRARRLGSVVHRRWRSMTSCRGSRSCSRSPPRASRTSPPPRVRSARRDQRMEWPRRP